MVARWVIGWLPPRFLGLETMHDLLGLLLRRVELVTLYDCPVTCFDLGLSQARPTYLFVEIQT
jgi:hypothetical protein